MHSKSIFSKRTLSIFILSLLLVIVISTISVFVLFSPNQDKELETASASSFGLESIENPGPLSTASAPL
jgi:flagellar basal body-associated protein FliL